LWNANYERALVAERMKKPSGLARDAREAQLFERQADSTMASSSSSKPPRQIRQPIRSDSMPITRFKCDPMPEPGAGLLEIELCSVLDMLPTGVLLLSPAGHIRFANAKFAQLFGLEFQILRKIEDYESLAEMLESCFRDTKVFSYRHRAFLAGSMDSSCDELEISMPARRVLERISRPVLDSKACPVGWLESYEDITSKRHFQSKILQTEKMAALGQLVSGIAHELNNPLTAIMGYAQLLLGRGQTSESLREAEHIYQEAERARRIVKNLLYFARESKPERSQANFNEIVERTLALRSYELKIENISVDCSIFPNLPTTLADPYQLQQVFLNLLVNAEQALLHSRGGGRVSIRTYQPSAQRVAFEVADDGPGVPPDIASRIFDPFFSTKAPGEGTGLGLSIAYGIVKQHGGEVYFENQPSGGARFVVDLPLISAAKPESPRESLPHEMHAAAVGASRILVVEDEASVANLIFDVLKGEGHYVECTLDSQEGLARLSRSRFDAILCDLRMPRLDGQGFYDALVRAGSVMKDRILFITGDTLAPRTRDFLEPRGLPHLDKPFLVEELILAVHGILERNRGLDIGLSELSNSPPASGRGSDDNPFEVSKTS
jgi:signal transduction histidine kinase/CheY-like chemotaxis protein